MNYFSLNNNNNTASFSEAVIQGIAPDKGLYFPESITPLDPNFIRNIEYFSKEEIAYETMKQFIGDEIPKEALQEIIADTLNFDFPLVGLDENVKVLELFHGPTLAFKDVGARFMSRCLGYFSSDNSKNTTVLVATSGDTGSAVANGFYNTPNVSVVILYPKNKVSHIQELQLTTLGNNITALAVDGVFDDCQAMVKSAFLDEDLDHIQLTSANSINVARWLPQMWYYFFAYKQLINKTKDVVVSVPSGNFGNICAGLMAKKLGLPIAHFIASTNENDVVPKFFETGEYKAQASKKTISNAMDVGDPSNFIRIQQLFGEAASELKEVLSSYSFNDNQTKETIKAIQDKYNYTLDPHGAVGYMGLKKYLSDHPNSFGICLETAHPIKFLDVVEPVIGQKIPLPESVKGILDKTPKNEEISSYEGLKSYLISQNKFVSLGND